MEDLEIGGAPAPVKPLARKAKAPQPSPMTDGTSALALDDAAPLEGTIEPEALATVAKEQRLEVFSTAGALEPIIAVIETLARKHVPDLTTDKGRKAIASVAANVAKCKVRLDDAGKELVAELKALPTTIDNNRRAMRERLDALRDETRAPLTEWEAEQARQRQFVSDIAALPIQCQGATAERLQEAINGLRARDLLQARDLAEEAQDAQRDALVTLEEMLAARIKADAEAAELVRLRQEAADREAQAAADRRARDLAAQALRDAEEAQARAEQRAKDAEAVAARAQADAEAAATLAKAETDAAAERAAQVERDRAAAAKRAEDAAAEAAANNLEHQRAFNREALEDLLKVLAGDVETAKSVLGAIYKKQVRHVGLVY